MSTDTDTTTERTDDVTTQQRLTDEERATFERLAEQYGPDHDVGRIARAMLHSDPASDDSEVANS